MLCFRDRSFCSAYGNVCVNSDCSRAVTSEVQADANRWWQGMPGNAPIAMMDMSIGCTQQQVKEAS